MERHEKLGPRLLRKWLRPRRKDAHKGNFGHVLVLGGSPGMAGAPRLAAHGALRSGAGLVTIGIPRNLSGAMARGARREAMTLPLPGTPAGTLGPVSLRRIFKYVRERGVTSLAVGPGLAATARTAAFVRGLLRGTAVPLVLDADGLNVLAGYGRPERVSRPHVITPHPGEAARLLGTSTARVQADRASAAKRLAFRGCVCVLKGRGTVVTDGRRLFVNPTGNPGMASGGMGDVLCGLIAGLMGQVEGDSPEERAFRAALTGVYIHGLAGDLAAQKTTRLGLLAGDLLGHLPAAFRKVFGKGI